MHHVALDSETDWDGWRRATRSLVMAGIEPGEITWSVGGRATDLPDRDGTFGLSRALVSLASIAIQAREPERFGLLYSLVWRANTGEKILEQTDDPDVLLASRLAHAVRAEAHRMRTHLRFMPVEDGRYLGWYTPAHFVLEANAQLMARRFADFRFSIVTPDGSAHCENGTPRFASGLRHAEDDDTLRAWWDAHGGALLETAREGTSVAEAEALDEVPRPPDAPPIGPVVMPWGADTGLVDTAREAGVCRRCDLYANATQTVFGEGPSAARALFIGEQPGDQEDVIGRPFVGPAGQMLDRALEEAGIDRRAIYITNAVKHFKFEARGKRRIHQSPDTGEITTCRVWLDVERERLKPSLLVLMGASGAQAVLGRKVAVMRERGRPFRLEDGQLAMVTVHPSYLLRIPDAARKADEYRAFVRDLAAARELMENPA